MTTWIKQRGGFGLIGILIVIAIIAILFGGKIYTDRIEQQKSTIETGREAVKTAEDLANSIRNKHSDINVVE